jgi:hypothetical protein
MKGKKELVLKLDESKKHNDMHMCKVVRLGKVLGKSHINSDSQHVHNEKIYAITRHDGIQIQVLKTQ